MVQITVTEAQTTVPALTIEDIMDRYHLDNCNPELYMLYISNLVMRGKLEDAKNYIATLPVDFVREVVNTTSYHTYYGTVLHVLLYWNNNREALDFYKVLTSLGARPIQDYYNQLPWEQTGILYVVDGYQTENNRIQEEFTWLYEQIQNMEKETNNNK